MLFINRMLPVSADHKKYFVWFSLAVIAVGGASIPSFGADTDSGRAASASERAAEGTDKQAANKEATKAAAADGGTTKEAATEDAVTKEAATNQDAAGGDPAKQAVSGASPPANPSADSPEESPANSPAITAESIEKLRKQAAESADLNAEAKEKAAAAFKQALDGLKRIAEVAGRTERFRNDTATVQQRVMLLRKRLAELESYKPTPPAELTLSELEQEVSRRGVELAKLKAAQTKSEAETLARVNRRQEIHAALLSANQRMADLQKQLDTPAPADNPPLLTAAQRTALQVRRLLIEAEQPALRNELAKYDAEDAANLLSLGRDVHTLETRIAAAELESLEELLNQQRAADSAAAVVRAREDVEAIPDALKLHAEQNVRFAEAADALSLPIKQAHRKLDQTKSRLEEIEKQFAVTQKRVSDIGLTGSIGALLRRQRVGLPDLRRRRKNIQERKTLIEDTQYAIFQYADLRSESMEEAFSQVLGNGLGNGLPNKKELDKKIHKNVSPSGSPNKKELDKKSQNNVSPNKSPEKKMVDKKKLEAAAQLLFDQRREYLDGVIRNYNTYLDTLFDLNANEERLIRETEQYEAYINERVLWIRSNNLLFSSFEIDDSDTWPFNLAHWQEVGAQLGEDLRTNPLVYAACLVLLGVLLWQKARIRRELAALSQVVRKRSCTEFKPTLQAILLTTLLAAGWPGLCLFLGWRLNLSSAGSPFAEAISSALLAVSFVYFPLEFLRRACLQKGLADSHFNWPASATRVLRVNLRWATLPGILFVFVTALLYTSESEHGFDSSERVFFVAGMVVLTVFMRRVLRPDTGIFHEYLAANPGGWFDRLKLIWYWSCVQVPLMIAGLAVVGFYYTAQKMAWQFYATSVFLVSLLLLRSFLERLLLVRNRTLSIQEIREKQALKAASGESAENDPDHIPLEELLPDVAENTEKSQRMIRTGLITASLIGLWLIWVNVLPALRILDEWPVWTTTVTDASVSTAVGSPLPLGTKSPAPEAEEQPIDQPVDVIRAVTVADIGLAVLIGVLTIACARNLPGVMEISILQRLPLDKSIRYAMTTITSYLIVLLGVILAFNAISVGWSKVQWLATALTFGLAFGLQEIFANFVAGLILLFERPIRVGDVVTVDDITGVVSRIRIRATTITNMDRKEYVIPNKEFITGRMLNWTLSDKTIRVVINVGVAYGSDVVRAKELLLQICNDHAAILKDPPTAVTFEGFGESSLNLVVRAFLPDLNNRYQVIDELHMAIDAAFRQEGIEIAFPQCDLHLRSVDSAISQNVLSDMTKKAA